MARLITLIVDHNGNLILPKRPPQPDATLSGQEISQQQAQVNTLPSNEDEMQIDTAPAQNQQVPQQYIQQYVLVNVPGDGSCQMSCFQLGYVAATRLPELLKEYTPGVLTADDIEDAVVSTFVQTSSMNVQEEVKDLKGVILNETPYDAGNLKLRRQIVEHWTKKQAVYLPKLKEDIVGILLDMLRHNNLLRRNQSAPVAQASIQTTTTALGNAQASTSASTGALQKKEKESQSFLELPDEDFIFNALYHPGSWRTFKVKSGSAFVRSQTSFGLSMKRASGADIPHGVDGNGIFGKPLREFWIKWLAAHHAASADFVTLHTIPAPTVADISDELVDLYMQEFLVNLHLWGTDASLQALHKLYNMGVTAFTFEEYADVKECVGKNDLFQGKNGRLLLYEAGEQDHFQILVGPFPKDFVRPSLPSLILPSRQAHISQSEESSSDSEPRSQEESDAEAEEEPTIWQALCDCAPDGKLQPPDGENPGLDFDERTAEDVRGKLFLNHVAEELGEDIRSEDYPVLLARLVTAVEETGHEFSTVEDAAHMLSAFEAQESTEDQNTWQALCEYAPDGNLQLPPGLNSSVGLDDVELDEEETDSEDREEEQGKWFLNCLADMLGEDIGVEDYPDLLERVVAAAEHTGQEFSNVEQAATLVSIFEKQQFEMLEEIAQQSQSEIILVDDEELQLDQESAADSEPVVLKIPDGIDLTGTECPEDKRQAEEQHFLRTLEKKLNGNPLGQPILERLFRAAASSPGANVSKVDLARAVIVKYERQQRKRQKYEGRQQRKRQKEAREKKLPSHTLVPLAGCVQQYFKEAREKKLPSHTLVPLAGCVQQYFDEYHIPLYELLNLLPPVQQYVTFHKRRSSWSQKYAPKRVACLKDLADRLRKLAQTYNLPHIAPGPSIADFIPVPSPLVRGEPQGYRMRAVLTLDPGDLVGYAPEKFTAWKAFKGELPGFVRAHLLNKHLGGPGLPANLAFVSSQSNTRMSQVGEETIKLLVLEKNEKIFYKVEMLANNDALTTSHGIAKELSRSIVHTINMYVCEVEKMVTQDQNPSIMCGPDLLQQQCADLLKQKGSDILPWAGGGISLVTILPDKETIGRILAAWVNIQKDLAEKASQPAITSYYSSDGSIAPEASELLIKAAKEIRKNPDQEASDTVMQNVQKDLNAMGVSGQSSTVATNDIKHRENQRRMVETAKRQREEQANQPSKRRKLNEEEDRQLAEIVLSQGERRDVEKFTEKRMRKYIDLRKAGADHFQAVNNSKKQAGRGPLKEVLTGFKNRKNKTGIYSFFGPPSDKGDSEKGSK